MARWRYPRRRRFGRFKRRFSRRLFSRRRSRRSIRRGGINSTRSRTVRVSTQVTLPLTATVGSAPNVTYYPVPLCFTPTQFPGFVDYAQTFSEFRVLKAMCKVHLAVDTDSSVGAPLANQPYTYLRVASRPFLESRATSASRTNAAGGDPIATPSLLAALRITTAELRQSRWQRQYYPSDIRNSISFKFYPYTLEWQGRPVGNTNNGGSTLAANFSYLKYRSGRRWMPMSFLGPNADAVTPNDDVTFFGPYFERLFSNLPDTQAIGEFHPTVTLSVWCQFRGQK